MEPRHHPSTKSAVALFFLLAIMGIALVLIPFCTKVNSPGPQPPSLTATTDTTVFAYDTVVLRTTGGGANGPAVRYIWHDSLYRNTPDTLDDTVLHVVFTKSDTGTHAITIRAWDKATDLCSPAARIIVRVLGGAPVLNPSADTGVLACDTITLHTNARDTNGVITGYRWGMDGVVIATPPATDSLSLWFATRDTGLHAMTVQAVDDDGILSNTDTILITVTAPKPRISLTGDTSAIAGDTATFSIVRIDSIGVISAYHWFLGNDTVPFITSTPTWRSFLPDTGNQRIIARAVGKDGMISDPDAIVIRVLPYRVTYIGMQDTIIHVHDTLTIRVTHPDTVRATAGYQWTLDAHPSPISTNAPEIRLVFGVTDTGVHSLTCRAFDKNGIFAIQQRIAITVYAHTPAITAMKDTVVSIKDPVVLHAHGADSGSILRYEWQVSATRQSQSSGDSTLIAMWPVADTGLRIISVRAMNDDSVWSAWDTVKVTVHPYRPLITVMPDTVAAIVDTIHLHASASDTNGLIRSFVWAIHDSVFSDTSATGSINASWAVNDTGLHTILVRVIDDDGMISPTDSIRIRINNHPPVLTPLRDTVVHRQDTLLVNISASDTNGSIARYLWSADTAGWTDSSASPRFRMFYKGTDTVRMRVGVRDDDGLLATDTFTVVFKRPLVFLTVTAPSPDSIVIVDRAEWDDHGVSVRFDMSARDTAGIGGFAKYQYTVYINKDSSLLTLASAYKGIDTTVTVATLDTAKYYWAIRANNKDDTSWASGTITTRLQKRIGFVGHSVVVGFRCDPGTGGFRKTVTDTLREKLGGNRAIKCVGPAITGKLLPAQDDSSLAVNGSIAWWLQDSLYYHPEYTADIWVVMIGVNGNYWYWEEYDALQLIDSLHMRNPSAPMYILNGLPLPANVNTNWIDPANLARFNRNMDAAVTRRSTYGWNIHLVDAHKAMMPGGVFRADLYPADEITSGQPLHPTQEGSDLIAREILKVMQEAKQW